MGLMDFGTKTTSTGAFSFGKRKTKTTGAFSFGQPTKTTRTRLRKTSRKSLFKGKGIKDYMIHSHWGELPNLGRLTLANALIKTRQLKATQKEKAIKTITEYQMASALKSGRKINL
jgi:hypothetical protein